MDELPRFVRDLIASFPQAGDGVHRHLFRLARYLHALRSEPDIFALLRATSAVCGRKVSDQEIHDAILNSRCVAWRPWETGQLPTSSKGKSGWPGRQHARIDELVHHGAGLYDLWETSPVRLEPTVTPEDSRLAAATSGGRSGSHTEWIVDALFPGNPLLCVARTHGRSAADFSTRRRERWRGHLSRCALMVPNAMARVYGKTRSGRVSQHALGADPATWSRHQFVRMPDGTRENGQPQPVYFFNPETLP